MPNSKGVKPKSKFKMIEKNYIQIPKTMCAGNKKLFDRIRSVLENEKDLKVEDNGMIFTIIKKEEQ